MKKLLLIILVTSIVFQVKAQIDVKLTRDTKLLDCQGIEFAKFTTLKGGDQVKLTDYYNDYFTVTAGGKFGYIYYPYLDEVAGLESFKKEHQQKNKDLKIESCRMKQLKEKYGNADGEKAFYGQPWIGMSSDIAIDLFGQPSKKNTTITQGYVGDQWVYPDRYLYFDNGRLTAIQYSK